MTEFVHLHITSSFSFLWGTFLPEELINFAYQLKFPYIALTDNNTLLGITRFYVCAKKYGIDPIIGAQIDIKDAGRIVFLVKNIDGYKNLCRIITQKNIKKQIVLKDIYNLTNGLICITGGRFSLERIYIQKRQIDYAIYNLKNLKELFRQNLYIAIQNHKLSDDKKVMDIQLDISRKFNIDTVVTHEVAYLKKQDSDLHKIFCNISKKYHHKKDISPLPGDNFFLTSNAYMEKLFANNKNALYNSYKIAKMCKEFELPLNKIGSPKIFSSPNKSYKRLSSICFKILARKNSPVSIEYLKRIVKELEVIKKHKLSDFFLIARDIYEFSKKRNIRCSIRGSAASSLVVYLLFGGVDPVENNLLFERFLNEGRQDFPDVDMDFDSERRDEVFEFIFDKYRDRCGLLSTVLTFRVRGAVRMIGRAMDYPYSEIKRLCATLPSAMRRIDIDSALKKYPELKNHPILKEHKLLEMVKKATSLPYASSTHLGGVIILEEPLENIISIHLSNKGYPVAELDKEDVEKWGLFKLDILGLRMHTAIAKSLYFLKKDISIEEIPLDDEATYKTLQKGDTIGVFQLESPGQRELVRRLKPKNFFDIVVEISLFRPGPVKGNMMSDFLDRRDGKQPIFYPCKELIPILKDTNGVIVFQEQVLEIAHSFAGMSYSEADAFRRAMTKDRSKEEMESLKEKFINGAIKLGHDESVAENVFDMVSCFAAYGFCKAHAASFAHITYISGYLKTHYPLEFYLGLLNAGSVGSYPPSVILNEAKTKGISLYPPHVNYSDLNFSPYKNGIIYPLTTVKFLGEKTAKTIIKEREKKGLFKNEFDLASRCKLSHRVIKMLKIAGAI